MIFNDEGNLKGEKNINEIALAALTVLPPESSMGYLKKLCKEEVAAQITDGNFKVEVGSLFLSVYNILSSLNSYSYASGS